MPFVRSDAASSLKTTQARFLLDLMGLEGRTEDQRRRAFRVPPHGSIEERWQVYACGYVARLVDALAGEHPATRRILGEDAFGSLVSRYVLACPPRSHDLAHAGERLPRFLESDPLTARLPFLPDLATLERLAGRPRPPDRPRREVRPRDRGRGPPPHPRAALVPFPLVPRPARRRRARGSPPVVQAPRRTGGLHQPDGSGRDRTEPLRRKKR